MGAKPTAGEAAEEWKWKVERGADTLIEAEKIQRDSRLLAAVRVELKKRQKDTAAAMKGFTKKG